MVSVFHTRIKFTETFHYYVLILSLIEQDSISVEYLYKPKGTYCMTNKSIDNSALIQLTT